MIVYDGLKSDFLRCCEQDDIADYIRNSILTKMGRHTPDNEYRAWENSLNFMYRVLNDPDIPNDAGIAIEYNVPLTAKRVDFMISGYDAYENPSVVIIELKQWQQLFPVEDSDSLVSTVLNGGLRQVVHPSYQAWSYAQLISDYNATVQDTDIKLHPCAYLHNYSRHNPDPLDNDQYKDYYSEAPAYSKGQNDKLRAFIKQFVSKGDQKKLLYEIDCGKIRPSKRLQDAIWSMMDESMLISISRTTSWLI